MRRTAIILLAVCLLYSTFALVTPKKALAFKYDREVVITDFENDSETANTSRFVQLAIILTTYLEGSFGSLLVLLFGSGSVMAFAIGRTSLGMNGVIALVSTLALRYVGKDVIAEGGLSGTFILFLAVLGAGFAVSGYLSFKDKDKDSGKGGRSGKKCEKRETYSATYAEFR